MQHDTTEIWRPVPGYEHYEVSSIGRVRSLPRPRVRESRLLRPRAMTSGHLRVTLSVEGTPHYQLEDLAWLNRLPPSTSNALSAAVVSIQVPWTCTYDGKRTVLASMSPEDVAAAARAHLCSEHRERLDAAESLA